MFDTTLIDLLVLSPVLLSLIFGFLFQLVEARADVRPLIKNILAALFFVILIGLCSYLKIKFAKISLILCQGLFEIDPLSSSLALAATAFFFLAVLLSRRDLEKRWVVSQGFQFTGLFLGLIFSHNIILVFVFSELIFIKAFGVRGKKLFTSDLQGLRIRLVGLIFILGSVAISYGAGKAATLSFLKSNAAGLYSADHTFLIGSLFFLSGLIKILWSLFESDAKDLNIKTIAVGLALIVAILKYSAADLFAVLQEAQILSQWLCVLSLLFAVGRLLQARYFVNKLKYGLLCSILLSLIFSLAFVFDGQGSQESGLLYLFISSFGILILLSLESRLRDFKGGDLTMSDLSCLGQVLPRQMFLTVAALILAFAFPLGLGFVVFASGLKLTFQTGFYWVGVWTLFASVGLWLAGLRVYLQIYNTDEAAKVRLLWKTKDLEDIKVLKSLVLLALVLAAPVALLYLFKS